MKRLGAIAALLAGAALVAACGSSDDGSPTAAENAQLNNIAEELDTSPDSLVPEDVPLGNGEAPAATGDLPVAGNGVAANSADGNTR
jgi:hypothetical protein